jgi:hypothetical protein
LLYWAPRHYAGKETRVSNRKLTPHQIDILTRLAFNDGDVTIPHILGSQDWRTVNSLKRRYCLSTERLTKLPGYKYSYGYRAIRIQCGPETLKTINLQLDIEGRAVLS